MPRFVVEHQHSAETCPAGDPQIAPMLHQHLSKANASQYGIEIHGEGVVNGAHRFWRPPRARRWWRARPAEAHAPSETG